MYTSKSITQYSKQLDNDAYTPQKLRPIQLSKQSYNYQQSRNRYLPKQSIVCIQNIICNYYMQCKNINQNIITIHYRYEHRDNKQMIVVIMVTETAISLNQQNC